MATLEQLSLTASSARGTLIVSSGARTLQTPLVETRWLLPLARSSATERRFVAPMLGSILSFWLRAKDGGMIADAHSKAESSGVGLYAVDSFYIKPPNRTGVVLGYAPLQEREIRQGIRCLAAELR